MAQSDVSLTFASFNVNGASRYDKQKDILDFIRKKKLDIIMLQETHIKSNSENYLRTLWGYNCFVCGHSNASKGVAILFKNTFPYKIHNVIKDNVDCSFLILDITISNERFTIANIYGPSDRDNADFFSNVFRLIEEIGNRQVVTAGDWNTLLDPSLDSRNYRNFGSRPRSRHVIKDRMEHLELADVYRHVYPNKRAYTWRRFNTIQQGRLDYILLSDILLEKVKNVDIMPGYRSDHSIVSVTLYNLQNNRPKTYWKFNNSLLKDKQFIDEIKKVILQTKKQYVLPIYNLENIENIKNEDIQFVINDQLFFETLLLEIRGKTISYASFKKRKNEQDEMRLTKEIEKFESNPNLNYADMLKLEECKLHLQELRDAKLRGMIIRSRVDWLELGEKPSNYFCHLENRNFKAKRMLFLEKENGDVIYEQDDLVEETKVFYKNLYKKQDINRMNLDNLVQRQKKLTNIEKESLEGQIHYFEAMEALKNMNNNKSPGNTGYTTEFYKFFFVDIGHFLIRSINYGFQVNKLSITQRQGVITCLPKEGKDPRHLNNWRPISLLNVAYKIASSCISNRIKRVLHGLIHPNQTGFQSNKFIGMNLQLMYNILTYTDTENIPGMLVLVDFFKAFDSIDWGYIEQVLQYLNFGNDMIKWVRLFYTDITSCVMVNGKYSEYFTIERGVRQGDPLSPYLFLLCVEILAQAFREHDQIKGIKIEDNEALLSQFADDTALYLDGSKESFENCIRLLSTFASISGLTINFQKTIVVWLGSKKNCNDRFLRDMNFTWDPGGACNSKFKYLGIFFSTNIENIVILNYENKLDEINKILKSWNKRPLTPFGKITVIKTLALSKLTYLFLNIPDPRLKFLKDLEKMFFSFLWNDKKHKIGKEHVYQDKLEGGLNMVNVYDYLSCMKISMYKRLFNDTDMKTLIMSMYPTFENLEKLGYEYMSKLSNEIPNPFWSDVIKHVKKIVSKGKPANFEEFVSEHILYNNNIKIGNEIVFFREWLDNDIVKIYNLTNAGQFLNYNEFVNKYPNVRTDFIRYLAIINAIKRYMRDLGLTCQTVHDLEEPVGWRILKSGKNIIKSEIKFKPNEHVSINKWNNAYPNLNWKTIYYLCHKTTTDSKLRWFQLRLLYRILPTNRLLHIYKIKNTAHCDLCNDIETLEHMLYDCPFVVLFWQNLYDKFVRNLPHVTNLVLSKELVIFGAKPNTVTDKPFNLLLMCGKYYIYTCRFTHTVPNVDIFLKNFKFRYRIEKYYSQRINSGNFDTIWRPYYNLVN